MKKRLLGKTGMEITEIGLGTWGLGGVYYGQVDDRQASEVINAYLDAGGNHIDSAFSYHKSEAMIGKALAGCRRDALVLASKSYAGAFARETRAHVRHELEISLRDLKTDYLDLYMIHAAPLDPDHLDELLDEYEKLKDEGKIRAIGVSIPGPQVTDEAVARARTSIASGRVEFIQTTYSIARQKLGEIFAAAHAQGIGIICRWVLESGLLAGKYEPGHEFAWPDTRNRYRPEERDRLLRVGHELKDKLPEGHDSPVQLAAAFALAEPAVSGILLGGVSAEQVTCNMAITTLPPLPPQLVADLKSIYGPRNDEFNPTAAFQGVPSVRH